MLCINPVVINMLDPVAIARAIRQSDTDILMLVRGGGAAEDFSVFDDPRVIHAMAECKSHRVVGLGHTGTTSLIHFVSDYVANTPAQAGCYVRERIELYDRQRQQAQQQRESYKKRLAMLEHERDTAKVNLMAARKTPVWWITSAFLAGALMVWMGNWLTH